MNNLDYKTAAHLETLQDLAHKTENRTETYDLQLNLIYEWIKVGLISKRQFKELLGRLVG